jgi:hypothetical protein
MMTWHLGKKEVMGECHVSDSPTGDGGENKHIYLFRFSNSNQHSPVASRSGKIPHPPPVIL